MRPAGALSRRIPFIAAMAAAIAAIALSGAQVNVPSADGASHGSIPPGEAAEGAAPSSSAFTRTVGQASPREADEPAKRSAIPDWALASAALMFAASALLLWIVRGRVRDWMVGPPGPRAPRG